MFSPHTFSKLCRQCNFTLKIVGSKTNVSEIHISSWGDAEMNLKSNLKNILVRKVWKESRILHENETFSVKATELDLKKSDTTSSSKVSVISEQSPCPKSSCKMLIWETPQTAGMLLEKSSLTCSNWKQFLSFHSLFKKSLFLFHTHSSLQRGKHENNPAFFTTSPLLSFSPLSLLLPCLPSF